MGHKICTPTFFTVRNQTKSSRHHYTVQKKNNNTKKLGKSTCMYDYNFNFFAVVTFNICDICTCKMINIYVMNTLWKCAPNCFFFVETENTVFVCYRYTEEKN